MYQHPAFAFSLNGTLMSQITGLTNQQVNEAVSSSFIMDLSPATAGRGRAFSVPDLLALSVYSDFTSDGVLRPVAGAVASKALQLLRADLINAEPTLKWAFFFPKRGDIRGPGSFKVVPFKANDGFSPDPKKPLALQLSDGDERGSTGFSVSFESYLGRIMRLIQDPMFLHGLIK